jgi:uncharacterized protein
MKVAITGASGLIGSELAGTLTRAGHQVAAFSRRAGSEPGLWPAPGTAVAFRWDPVEGGQPGGLLREAEAVVHLAGEPLAQRWTPEAKRRIFESRQNGTRNLVRAMAEAGNAGALISASAIGYYGSRGDELLDESTAPGSGFLAKVCQAWENAALGAEACGIRVARARIGIALSPKGGALRKMRSLFNLCLGGRLGAGNQWMSWIHLEDLARLLQFLVEKPISGAVNAAAPNPVTNAEFTRSLADTLGRPAALPAPAFALRALLGEMAGVLLDSQRVFPRAAQDAGFVFRFPSLALALEELAG